MTFEKGFIPGVLVGSVSTAILMTAMLLFFLR